MTCKDDFFQHLKAQARKDCVLNLYLYLFPFTLKFQTENCNHQKNKLLLGTLKVFLSYTYFIVNINHGNEKESNESQIPFFVEFLEFNKQLIMILRHWYHQYKFSKLTFLKVQCKCDIEKICSWSTFVLNQHHGCFQGIEREQVMTNNEKFLIICSNICETTSCACTREACPSLTQLIL